MLYIYQYFNPIRISKPNNAAGSQVNALLTQSSKYISLCISESFALLQGDYLGQFFLKYQEKLFQTSASTFCKQEKKKTYARISSLSNVLS